jgi:2-amino-4-hydroxy-6-hydroxymethyldihydropteridine diphosphokinase
MTTAYIALGSNLGDSIQHVNMAILALGQMKNTKLLMASSLYKSEPIDADGDDYVNAVVKIETHLNAYELLAELQKLETQAGRASSIARLHLHNAPRTLDLDILLYGDASISSATLTVPHPRMLARAFVLLPLKEIAPDLVNEQDERAVKNQIIEALESTHRVHVN